MAIAARWVLEDRLFKFALISSALAVAVSASAGLHPNQGTNLRIKHANVFSGLPKRFKDEIVPGQIRVRFTQTTAAQLALIKPVGDVTHTALYGGATQLSDLTFISRIGQTGWTLWSVPLSTDTVALAKSLKQQAGVYFAEPVHKVHMLLATPNDTDFNYTESSATYILDLSGDGTSQYDFRRLWHLDDTNAWNGWSTWPNTWFTAATLPAGRQKIAIIDSGIDPNHPDFINPGGSGTDIAHGGQIDFAHSGSVQLGTVSPGTDMTDDVGHGTHVTGLAVAAGNNGGVTYSGGDDGTDTDGVIGMGYNCEAMILKVVYADYNSLSETGTDTDAAAAMFYAADNGADIISLSIGDTSPSQIFQDATTYAFQKGTLVVAAGMEEANQSGMGDGNLGPIYPAACSGALAVEALAPGQNPAVDWYAGVGNYVDIAAAGGDVATDNANFLVIQYVFSTAPQYSGTILDLLTQAGANYPPFYNDYAYLAGTSMACPIVSGSAGLYYGMKNYHQGDGYVNVQTYRALELAADGVMGAPYGSWEPVMGYGALDVGALMTNSDTRGSQVGSIKGIVYSNGTPTGIVAVHAKLTSNTGLTYTATTELDGTYRFEFLPPGMYNVTTAPNGLVKTKVARVKAGSDQPGFDFWCGSYTGDDTPPTVPFFNVTAHTSNSFTLHQWGYDTETGIDSILIRVGTTQGASDVMADTLLVPDTNSSAFTGLTLGSGLYYVHGTYTDGAGLVTTVDTTFGAAPTFAPTGFTVFRGALKSGNLSSLLNNDGNRLAVQNGPTLNTSEAPITLYVTGTAPVQTASSLGVTVIGEDTTNGLTQGIDMFDFVANGWVALDSRAGSPNTNMTVTVNATNPNRFIQSGSKTVQIRITLRATGPTQGAIWQEKTDQVQWSYSP